MAVGLALAGTLPADHRVRLAEARDWLSRAAVWFESAGDAVLETRLTRDDLEHPLLHVHFHPAGEPMQLRVGGSGKVSVHARTSPVGPGYHAHLCELLKDFAEDFDIQWNDPSPDRDPAHFFAHGDLARLERHFLHWLALECSNALRRAEPGRTLAVGLPRPLRFLHPGPVLTPLGPRSVEWLKRVAGDAAAGRDFFPWWSPELDAEFYARRAETDLWLAFPWREPLTESEGEVVDQIAADLANAHEADPDAALPWSAWAATLDALAIDAGKFTVEPMPERLAPTIRSRDDGAAAAMGYRRHPVVAILSGGWQMHLPGRLAIRREDDGRTWTAWDDEITVWLRDQSLGHPERDALPTPSQAVAAARRNLPPGEPVEKLAGRVVGEAVFDAHVEDGRTVGRLSGVAAAGNRLAVLNIFLRDPADRARAVDLWRTLARV
jgi:hypothetical protein